MTISGEHARHHGNVEHIWGAILCSAESEAEQDQHCGSKN
jgi:hypothetical protein